MRPPLSPRLAALLPLFFAACASSTPPATSQPAATTADAADSTVAADGAAAADSAGTDAKPAASGPTYHKDIAPILQASCQGCHAPGKIGPFPLTSFAEAKTHAPLLLDAIDGGRMPPWGARETAQCKPTLPFRHDLRLTKTQRDTLKAWIDAEMPEGDAKDAPKGSALDVLTLEGVQAEAKPIKPYVAKGTSDILRCFVLDLEFTEQKFLNAVQFVPGNPAVVHHALLFLDETAAVAKKADADGGYDCFGGAGVDSAQLVGAWAPGSVPLEFPPDVGTPIAKGSRLVLQVHYHPAGETHAPDATKVQLRYTATTPKWLGFTALIGNFPSGKNGEGLLPGPNDPDGKPVFVVPPGVKDHTETMRFTLPDTLDGKAMPELHVFGVGTHMHYVGKSMRIDVERPATRTACTAEQVAPLAACLQDKCPGLQGQDLVTCAVASCSKAVGGLTGKCGDCLQAGVITGKPSDAIVADCQKAVPQARKGPGQECLVETPDWDFDWQRIYNFDAPIENLPVVKAGDVLTFTCKYDNSLENGAVALALAEQGLSKPIPVKLGEQTLDEMCLGVLQVIFKPAK